MHQSVAQSVDIWEPIHPSHAIEIVGAAITFGDFLTDSALRRALRSADKLTVEAGLTGRRAQSNLTMKIVGGAISQADTQETNGMSFQRTAMEDSPDGKPAAVVSDELVVTRQSLIFRSRRYNRWTQFAEFLDLLVNPLLDDLLPTFPVNAVRLEYRDRFEFTGKPEDSPTHLLLDKNSMLIAPHVFALKGLWHSHTGMFEVAPEVNRRLIQVEVGSHDRDHGDRKRRAIAIMTAVQDEFLVAGVDVADQTTSQVMGRFSPLHDRSKALFAALITKETSERIGLKMGEQ